MLEPLLPRIAAARLRPGNFVLLHGRSRGFVRGQLVQPRRFRSYDPDVARLCNIQTGQLPFPAAISAIVGARNMPVGCGEPRNASGIDTISGGNPASIPAACAP